MAGSEATALEVGVDSELGLSLEVAGGVDGVGDALEQLVVEGVEDGEEAVLAGGEVLVEGAAGGAGAGDDVGDGGVAEALLADGLRHGGDEAVAMLAQRTAVAVTRPPRWGMVVTLRWRPRSGAESGGGEVGAASDLRRERTSARPWPGRRRGSGGCRRRRGSRCRCRAWCPRSAWAGRRGVWVDVLAVVQGVDGHGHRGAGRDDILAEAPGPLDQAADHRDDGARTRIASWTVASTYPSSPARADSRSFS